MSAEDSVEFRY